MSAAQIQTEFTSRYDGSEPSWLRACFECEAMGCVPRRSASITNAEYFVHRETIDQQERTADFDGYVFLPCPRCHGSARVSWLRTIARIPRWLWRGIPFIWQTRRFNGEAGVWANCWMAFKCAYLADLGLWRP